MSQLQTQEVGTPKSKLPRKLQERERKTDSNNRDIEAFFASPLGNKSPNKTVNLKVTPSPLSSKISINSDIKKDEAYQTMIAFKKNPEPLL